MVYEMNLLKMIWLGLVMGTFVVPLKDAIKGYMKLSDPAWFIHPVLCFQVAFCYAWNTFIKSVKSN